MNYKSIFSKLIVLVVALCSSCATSYQAKSWTGGYDDFRISRDTFVVSFGANSLTSSQTVYKYALRRASELTLQNGYSYFTVVEKKDTTDRSLYASTSSDSSGSILGDINYGCYSEREFSSTSVSEIKRPGLELVIKCYDEKPNDAEAINAQEYLIFNSLDN